MTFVLSPLAEEFNYETGQKVKEEINGRFILSLINICRKLEDTGILSLESILINHTTGLQKTEVIIGKLQEDMANIREKLKLETQALFNNYIYLYGSIISNHFCEYLESIDWLHIPEPRDINSLILGINKQLNLIEAEMEIFFNKKATIKSKKFSQKPKKGMFQMEHEMERLLAKKVKIFSNVENNREELLLGIMKISLKTMYEGIRNLRISKFGYQQLQVDLRFIETILEDIYGLDDETGILGGLFKEAIHSAKIRCFEPVEISEDISKTITELKISKLIA